MTVKTPLKKPKPKAPKLECPHCGRKITSTHMHRHQGTWACYQARLARELSAKLEKLVGEQPEGYESAGYYASAAVQLAYALGIEDQLRPAYTVYITEVHVDVAAPEWVVRAAATLKRYRDKPSVVKDVTIVCRYLSEHESPTLLEGFMVALSLIKEDEDLSWGDKGEAARELFRETASKVIRDDPEFALDASTRLL